MYIRENLEQSPEESRTTYYLIINNLILINLILRNFVYNVNLSNFTSLSSLFFVTHMCTTKKIGVNLHLVVNVRFP